MASSPSEAGLEAPGVAEGWAESVAGEECGWKAKAAVSEMIRDPEIHSVLSHIP